MKKWRDQARDQDSHAAHHLRSCASDLCEALRAPPQPPDARRPDEVLRLLEAHCTTHWRAMLAEAESREGFNRGLFTGRADSYFMVSDLLRQPDVLPILQTEAKKGALAAAPASPQGDAAPSTTPTNGDAT